MTTSHGRPPDPNQYPNLSKWADDLVKFLSGDPAITQVTQPQAVQLAHKIGTGNVGLERASTDGILMYDPAIPSVVVSIANAWQQLGASGVDYLPIAGGTLTGPLDIGSLGDAVGQNVTGDTSAAGLSIHNFTPAVWLYDRSTNVDGILLQAESRAFRIYNIPFGGGQGAEMLRVDPEYGGTVYVGDTLYKGGSSSQDGMRITNTSIGFQRDGAETNAYGARISYYWGTTYSFKLNTNGNVQNANNSYGSLSDARMKTDVVDASPQLDDLMRLRVVNFVKTNDPEQRKQIGLIAQEVQDVKPGWVEPEDEDTGMLSVKYSLLPLSLLKALQEATARIDALENQLAQLNPEG